MDRFDNPFAPGAGTPPPELAGRDEILDALEFAAEKCRRGGPARCLALLGLRGVGKTVVLARVREQVENRGIMSAMFEASEARSLPSLLAPELRHVLLRLSGAKRRREAAQRAMRALAGFVSALKVRYEPAPASRSARPGPLVRGEALRVQGARRPGRGVRAGGDSPASREPLGRHRGRRSGAHPDQHRGLSVLPAGVGAAGVERRAPVADSSG